ncbi:MAG: TonB-dependent receptor plug domain-containing protein, partial [Candidatus Latescibacteria bacterium]|nr:TonB-dependent receptor plug domain-containing protein [Candidatus Latescibacterota bacterium]
MKYSFCILTAAIVFFTRETLSQTLSVYELEPITSTVNRTVSFGDDTGTLEVITHEMIKQGNYKNVSEVLRTIPGIYYVSESILGNRSTESNTGSKIRIRGKGAKLLIDGRPMNMAIFGCLTNNMLTLDHVERIEVTRGSESVLYGSDGLGGVINIITREPNEFGGEFQVQGGGYSTVISSFSHDNTIGPFGYFVSGSLKRSDGYRGDSDYADENGYAKMNYRINESTKIESSLNMYNGNWNDPGTLYNPQADFWANFKRRHSDITLKGKSKTASYTIKAFHNEGHHIFTDQDGWQSRDYTNGLKADMVKNFTGGKNRLIFGADGRW